MKKGLSAVVLFCLFAVLSSSGVQAAITSVTPVIAQIAAPASVNAGVLTSDTVIRAFDERQDVTLAAPLAVDITVPGTYDGSNPLSPGTIATGTVVRSHFIHFDAATDTPTLGVSVGSGSVTFDQKILGVITEDTNLNTSDSLLGAPATTYPTGLGARGLFLSSFEGDSITVGCNTLTVNNLFNQADISQFRVITGPGTCLPTGGLEGCVPRFWRKEANFSFWSNYMPSTKFDAVFGVKSSKPRTLLQALGNGKGAERAFKRQAVAALLNADNAVIHYNYTPAQVRAIVQNTYATGNFKTSKLDLASQNNLSCPFQIGK